MKKEFTTREKGMIKNTAKNVYPLYAKLEKLHKDIEEMSKDAEIIKSQINSWEAGVMSLTGYTTMDLVNRELIEVGTNEKGQLIRKANYTLKYEEVLPPINECTTEPVSTESPINTNETETIDTFNPNC